jgi:hypothetical protein
MLAENPSGLAGPFAGSAIRISGVLHIRGCGVPPRNPLENEPALLGLKIPPGTSIVPA